MKRSSKNNDLATKKLCFHIGEAHHHIIKSIIIYIYIILKINNKII